MPPIILDFEEQMQDFAEVVSGSFGAPNDYIVLTIITFFSFVDRDSGSESIPFTF